MPKPIQKYSHHQVIAELKSEITMRHTVFGNKVQSGAMTEETKTRRIELIQEAINIIEQSKPGANQTTIF